MPINLKEVLNNIPESLVVCDNDYNVILINNSFARLYKNSTEQIINNKLQNIIKNTSNITCHICNGKPTKYIPEDNYFHQATLIDFKGKEIIIRISHSISNDGKYYISTIVPISELICLNQAQIDFVSTVSHELRTPMTSIKGFADTLLASGDKLTKDQQTRFISIIKNQADRLTRLVENLLTVSRLETQKYKPIYRPLNLNFYIDRVIFALKSKYPNHNFQIKTSDNIPCVWADQDKLEQILTNLIDNAAKYSKENTTVLIKVSMLPEDADKIKIQVIDNGIGIPKEHLSKIFNKFSRIDNPLTRNVQGTGLGLFITKALTDSMGGSISVSSSENGSCFTVILLASTPERQAKQGLVDE